jgi:nitrite reductase (NO-forming)
MELKIVVTDAAAGGGQASTASAATTGANPDDAVIDFNAKPADGWKARDPKLGPALTGTVHDIEIQAKETELEVSPGVKQMMWTYDGTFPGPVYRGKVGDTFNFTLVNDAGNQVDHSIDFHASKVAWNDKMRSIKPGESLTYPFKAEYAGVYMFHCGTAPALHHIGNGMHGMIIIEPADLPPVDKEFYLIQSEIYTGPQGQPGDLKKMLADQWDAVVFNGYVNQYKHQPIRVEPNERIRVWIVDNGPSENSAFHVVGTIFDTVWKEGSYLLRPDQRQGGSQVLDLQPAQGGFVEFSFAEAGLYPIVTHKFSNASQGALGLFQAGEVATSGGGH